MICLFSLPSSSFWPLKFLVPLCDDQMEDFSADVGIPMNCIFPVNNYHKETSLDGDVTALVLDALKNIVTTGVDHLEEVQPRNH